VGAPVPGAYLASERLVPELVAAAYRAVEGAYPEEGCGFVFETPAGELRLVATANRATFLHQKDPVAYPRDGRTYFEPDMKPWLAAAREGHAPRLIFHSHPDEEAYFSETDRASAIVEDPDAGGVFERNPGVLHMVVSVRPEPPTARYGVLFRYEPATTGFVEIARFDADGRRTA
jgi:proteasome lid subunit RPN8/RPN11